MQRRRQSKVGEIIVFASDTDNLDNITLEHIVNAETAIVDSIGHLDNDTGRAGLVGLPGVRPQVDRCAFPECLQEAGGGKVTCAVDERKHSVARCERTALGTLERSCLKGIACAGGRAVRVLFSS